MRQKDLLERKRVEEEIRAANEADAKALAERRLHLKNITEQDRKMKMLEKIGNETKTPKQSGEDLISKVFNRTAH